MRLVCIVHHLLISPLGGELRVGLVVVRVLEVHLALGRMAVKRVGLLVGILVERGIVRLMLVLRGPSCLLLLHWIRVGLLSDWCG